MLVQQSEALCTRLQCELELQHAVVQPKVWEKQLDGTRKEISFAQVLPRTTCETSCMQPKTSKRKSKGKLRDKNNDSAVKLRGESKSNKSSKSSALKTTPPSRRNLVIIHSHPSIEYSDLLESLRARKARLTKALAVDDNVDIHPDLHANARHLEQELCQAIDRVVDHRARSAHQVMDAAYADLD